MNVLTHRRSFSVHASSVTGLIFSSVMHQIYSCSKDKSFVWHCSESGSKLGRLFSHFLKKCLT